jgi:hypothetical protein
VKQPPVRSLPFNSLNAELNPICHLLALLGAHHILHVSRIRVKAEGFIPAAAAAVSTQWVKIARAR